MQPSLSDLSPRSALSIQLGACVLFIAAMVWGFGNYFYSHDFFFYACNAQSYRHWFDALLARDFDFRYRPLFFLLFQIEYLCFGLSQTGYFVVSVLFHSANSFAVFFLCRRFGARVTASLLASLLFLTSCLYWSPLMDVISVSRHAALLLFILGILAFVHNGNADRPVIWMQALSKTPIACFVATLLLVEDTITFPAMLLAAYAFAPRDTCDPQGRTRSGLSTIAICFAISLAFLFYVKMSGAGRNYGLSYGWHSLQKLITMPRQMLQYLLVPDPTWGLPRSVLLRLLPMALIFGSGTALLLTARKEERWTFLSQNRPLVFFAHVWIFITVLPYLSRPSGWTWFNRYLHFPSVGALMLAGIFGDACCRRLIEVLSGRTLAKVLMIAIVAYLGIFGVFSTILIRKEACRNSEPFCAVGRQEAQLLFGLLCELHALKTAPQEQISLLAHPSPFAPQRLQAMLDQYMGPAKAMLVDDASSLPSTRSTLYAIRYRNRRWGAITPIPSSNPNTK